MNVRFGNLTVTQFIKKHDAYLTDEEIKELESMRVDNAQGEQADKFHIFDLPSTGFVVSKTISSKVVEILKSANDRKTFTGRVYVEEY